MSNVAFLNTEGPEAALEIVLGFRDNDRFSMVIFLEHSKFGFDQGGQVDGLETGLYLVVS